MSSEFRDIGVYALVVYVLLMLGGAELARRARTDESPADHFLAGRRLGVLVLFLTLYSTAYSGNSLLGYPGEAYRRGYSWIMATGFMMSIVVVFHALAPRLRPVAVAQGFLTPGDCIRHRFRGDRWQPALLLAVAALMAVALANFLLAQLTAMGHVTHEVTGGTVPFAVGVVGLAALILVYETIGGMRAVAWTDAAQAVVMLVGLLLLLAWALGSSGGLAETTRAIAATRPQAVQVPDATEAANWASSILLLGLASVVYPQAIQRIYAARSGQVLARSLAFMSFMPLTTTFVVTLIGVIAIPRFGSLGGIEADTVMPRLLAEWAAEGPLATLLALTVLLGALAAIMSTADSCLLSLGSIIAIDFLGRPSDRPETTRIGKGAAAAVMGVAVLVALVPRATLWRLIELKMELLIQCVPAFLLAIHWGGMRAGPTLAGVLAGTALAAGAALAGWTRIGGVHVGVVGLALNLGVVLVGSWLALRPQAGRAVDGTGTPRLSAR